MIKKVIVACAGAIATSTVVATRIKELAKRNNINVYICQVRMSEIASYVDSNTVLIIPTARVKREFGVPVIVGTPFISGIRLPETEEKILQILKREE